MIFKLAATFAIVTAVAFAVNLPPCATDWWVDLFGNTPTGLDTATLGVIKTAAPTCVDTVSLTHDTVLACRRRFNELDVWLDTMPGGYERASLRSWVSYFRDDLADEYPDAAFNLPTPPPAR